MNEFLRNKRLEKGLFQREVAKKMGCSASWRLGLVGAV